MKTSEQINEVISALAKAQGMMAPAIFNKKNPHFGQKYADFTSCMDACRLPLSQNGLAIVQACQTIDGKLFLVTMIAHTSGQWLKSEFPLNPSKQDSQGIGSAMTYAKRYSLCGILGIVADEDGDDDDGETSVGRSNKVKVFNKPNIIIQPPKPIDLPKISEEKIIELLTLESQCDSECVSNCKKYMSEKLSCTQYADLTEPQYRSVKNGYTMNIKKHEVVNA